MRVRRLVLLPVLLLAAACHQVAPAGPAYRLRVENRTDRIMVVSYQDDGGTGVLGTVGSGRTGSFVLSDVAGTQVTVSARSSDGALTSGPHPVTFTERRARLVLE